jgi:hypothetical protein
MAKVSEEQSLQVDRGGVACEEEMRGGCFSLAR